MPNLDTFLLTVKLLTIVAPTIALTTLWKRRTKTTWTPIFAAIAALLIFALLRLPLNEYVINLPFLLQRDLPHLHFLSFHSVAIATIYGTTRETVRWLLMRYPASAMKTWRDAVLFGLAYAAGAAVFDLSVRVKWLLFGVAGELETVDTMNPDLTQIEILISLHAAPLLSILHELNARLPWMYAATLTPFLTFVPIALNVGTGLAILYSVRARKLWPFLAAIFCYIAADSTRKFLDAVIQIKPIAEFGQTYELVGKIYSAIPQNILMYVVFGFNPLYYILPALAPLALALYVKRRMIQSQTTTLR